MKALRRRIICQLFMIYVATNMAVCAIVFFPWALPRETVSGLIGRWKVQPRGKRRAFAVVAAIVVDRIYFWEPNHCVEVYRAEHQARLVLYPERPGAKP